MNIEPKLITEKELNRINFLRETSLTTYYRSGAKSLYQYICHNVINFLLSMSDFVSFFNRERIFQRWRISAWFRWWRKELAWRVSMKFSIRWIALTHATTANTSIHSTCSLHANLHPTNRPSLKSTWRPHLILTLLSWTMVTHILMKDSTETEHRKDSWRERRIAWQLMPKFMMNTFAGESIASLASKITTPMIFWGIAEAHSVLFAKATAPARDVWGLKK